MVARGTVRLRSPGVFASFLLLALGLSTLVLAGGENKATCAEKMAVAQTDLSLLTATTLQQWSVGMRSALLDRLDSEILELHPSFTRTRAARLLDLYLLTLAGEAMERELSPGLEKLGFRRLNSGPVARNRDFSEEDSPSGSVYPLNSSTYYVQIENELGYRIAANWMIAGALTSRFKAWNIYKIRFLFPSIHGFGGPHLADWVPCFHGEGYHPGLITRFTGAGQRWEHNLMPQGPRHESLEKVSPEVLIEPYSDLALRKMELLGWKEAASVLSKLDPCFSLTLLKMAGYEANPFRREELFWSRNSSRSTSIAVRVLGALKVMNSLNASLMPLGTMPRTAIAPLKADIRKLERKDKKTLTEFMVYLLSFSGVVTAKQRHEQYADTQPDYYFRTDELNRRTQFTQNDSERILRQHSLEKEDRSYWARADSSEYDLLRTLDFMVSLGMIFDETTNEWTRL